MPATDAITLTPRERSALKARAHALSPVVIVGAAGLTPAVAREIEQHLAAHELIKVRVTGEDRAVREAVFERLTLELSAAAVQHIGKLIVLYRPKAPATPAPPGAEAARTRAAAKATLAGRAPRKTSAPSPARAPRSRDSGSAATVRATKTARPVKAARPVGPAAPARQGRAPAKTARSARSTRATQPPRTARVRKSGQRSAKKPFQGN